MKTGDEILNQAVCIAGTMGHISRQSFTSLLIGKSGRTKRLRWKECRESGLFSKPHFLGDMEYLILNHKGRTVARNSGIRPAPIASRNVLFHDELVTKFAVCLSRDRLIRNWIPEIQLKKGESPVALIVGNKFAKKKYPDLLFELEIPGPTVRMALEIELSLKSARRYDSLLYAYSTATDIDSIIFVTKNDVIRKALQNAIERLNFPEDNINVLFAFQNDVEKNPARAPLASSRTTRTIKSLVNAFIQQRKNRHDLCA